MEVGDKLKELNMTEDEMDRLSKAFKDEKFWEMLRDYAEELSDPENKKRYEEEITLLERERGNTIKFIHPEPFRALRTSVNGKQKCFINICTNGKVGQPECKWGVLQDGRRGQSWSLPHSLHPGRQDTDPKGNKIMIYDVVFHPDTLHIASKNKRFMDMVDSTAIEGIQNTFKVTLDKNNVREVSTKYKGTPQPCVIRKPIPGHETKEASEMPHPLAFPYPDEKRPTTSSHTEKSSSVKPNSFQKQPLETKEPNYSVKYRHFVDIQDFRCSRDSAQSPRPKEIVVTIDLPLLEDVSAASLEVKEQTLLLENKDPAYRLELPLAYPVHEDKGQAKFNKHRGQLTVTLTVLPSDEAFDFPVVPAQTGVSDDERQEEDQQEEKGEREGQKSEEEEVKEERDTEEVRCQEEGEEETLHKHGDQEISQHNKLSEDGCERAAEKKDSGVSCQRVDRCRDISPEEENSHVASPETEAQPVLITAEHSECTVKDGDEVNLESSDIKEETEMTEETLDGNLKVETYAGFLQHRPSEESQAAAAVSSTQAHSQSDIKDCCVSQTTEDEARVTLSSEELATGSVKQEGVDEDDLPTEQIFHDEPPPALLREIDEDGNEKVICDHSTSAGIIFQNTLMFELD